MATLTVLTWFRLYRETLVDTFVGAVIVSLAWMVVVPFYFAGNAWVRLWDRLEPKLKRLAEWWEQPPRRG